MKKSNIIIYTVLVLLSAFLLWMWYFLGLNHVDEPLDLLLSIIWWVMMVGTIITIIYVERQRKERIRTVYVTTGEIFNIERGRQTVEEPAKLVETISEAIGSLKYGFSKKDFPEETTFAPKYLIRTSKIKDDDWQGAVVNTGTKHEMKFKDREELTHILATQAQ